MGIYCSPGFLKLQLLSSRALPLLQALTLSSGITNNLGKQKSELGDKLCRVHNSFPKSSNSRRVLQISLVE